MTMTSGSSTPIKWGLFLKHFQGNEHMNITII